MREILEHADELAQQFENYEPKTGDERDVESLGALRSAVLQRSAAERALQLAVERTRLEGHSWATIGQIIGTSGEAARQRYAHKQQA